jgi:hypothetical protein
MSKWNEDQAEWQVDWVEPDTLRHIKESKKEESTWTEVMKDIRMREAAGVLKYGKYLTPHTTEDTLQHLYEELLDAVVYIKTEILKRKEQ